MSDSADSEKRQWKGNTGGGTLGQRLLILLFRWWGLRVGYALMAFVIPFYMLFARKGYLSIYRYFRNHFSYPPLKAFWKTYINHYRFGQVILDRFAVFAGKKDDFEVEVIGNEHYQRLENGEKGFIMASSHIGNFEIGGYLLRSEKKEISALIYAGETQTVQQNRTTVLNTNNIKLVPVLGDMSHLFIVNAALQNGEIVSMPCDRNLGSAKSVDCQFLNGIASFPIGAFALAASNEVEVLAVFVIKVSVKKYKIFVKPIRIDIDAAEGLNKRKQIELYVRAYVKEVECIVRQYPEQWFNYYDFWKN